ncbi:hypothetical protein [Bacillus thuringiensis]|uniref:hypothetical protein n=1 Tax=Bacillus thuringiensis TaxID=1428 RepID=UPI001CF9640C|nr:hypothetical protein [Bacillus thuringiensis]
MYNEKQVTYKITDLKTVDGQNVVEGLAYVSGIYYIWDTNVENSNKPKVQKLYEYDLKNIHTLQLEQHQYLKLKIEEYVLKQRLNFLFKKTDTKEAIRKLINYLSDLYKEPIFEECGISFRVDEDNVTVKAEGIFEQEAVALGVCNNLFSSYDRDKNLLCFKLEDILISGAQLSSIISLTLNLITFRLNWKSRGIENQGKLTTELQKEEVENETIVKLEEISSNERIRMKQLEIETIEKLEEISSNERIRMKQLDIEKRNPENQLKLLIAVLENETLSLHTRAVIASIEAQIERRDSTIG